MIQKVTTKTTSTFLFPVVPVTNILQTNVNIVLLLQSTLLNSINRNATREIVYFTSSAEGTGFITFLQIGIQINTRCSTKRGLHRKLCVQCNAFSDFDNFCVLTCSVKKYHTLYIVQYKRWRSSADDVIRLIVDVWNC